jgi:hypothetical protein
METLARSNYRLYVKEKTEITELWVLTNPILKN